eukprot:2009296-Heterocapsa_arctica.AAC.1
MFNYTKWITCPSGLLAYRQTRHKWYECVRQHAIQSLIQQPFISEHWWHFVMREDEFTTLILDAAKARLF